MCGRYTLTTPTQLLRERFALVSAPNVLPPRFNIAPGQDVAVVRHGRARRLEMFRWGLVPSWAKDPAIGNRMINARAETLAEKPSFREAFRRRRCLVLADGFYEWKKEGKQKTPMYVRLHSREPFAFAGLWESWHPSGTEEIRSCTIVTTTPNQLLVPIHDRMPVILALDEYDAWLEAEPRAAEELRDLLRPFPADRMEAYPVSRLVNSPANDRPECVAPV